MRTIYRVSILFLLIVLALFFASIGSMNGMGIFLVLGFLFEAAFWLGLFNTMKKRKGTTRL